MLEDHTEVLEQAEAVNEVDHATTTPGKAEEPSVPEPNIESKKAEKFMEDMEDELLSVLRIVSFIPSVADDHRGRCGCCTGLLYHVRHAVVPELLAQTRTNESLLPRLCSLSSSNLADTTFAAPAPSFGYAMAGPLVQRAGSLPRPSRIRVF